MFINVVLGFMALSLMFGGFGILYELYMVALRKHHPFAELCRLVWHSFEWFYNVMIGSVLGDTTRIAYRAYIRKALR